MAGSSRNTRFDELEGFFPRMGFVFQIWKWSDLHDLKVHASDHVSERGEGTDWGSEGGGGLKLPNFWMQGTITTRRTNINCSEMNTFRCRISCRNARVRRHFTCK